MRDGCEKWEKKMNWFKKEKEEKETLKMFYEIYLCFGGGYITLKFDNEDKAIKCKDKLIKKINKGIKERTLFFLKDEDDYPDKNLCSEKGYWVNALNITKIYINKQEYYVGGK